MYQEEIDKFDIRKIAYEVITRKNSSKKPFVITSFVTSGMLLFR